MTLPHRMHHRFHRTPCGNVKPIILVILSDRRESKDLRKHSAQEDRNLQLYEFAENLCGIEAHTAGRVKTLPYKIKVLGRVAKDATRPVGYFIVSVTVLDVTVLPYLSVTTQYT